MIRWMSLAIAAIAKCSASLGRIEAGSPLARSLSLGALSSGACRATR